MASAPVTDATQAKEAAGIAMDKAKRWTLNDWWGLIKASLVAWKDDYAPSMGAALSYYTVFSLAPLLVIVISVAGLIFGAEAVRGEVFSQIEGLMGPDAAKGIQELLSSVSEPSTGIIGAAGGVVVLLIGATTVFGELQDALDRIWRAPVRAGGSGLWTLVRTRLLSFGMILGIAFLLVVSLVSSAGLAALGKWWGGWFVGWQVLAEILNAVIGFAVTTGVFALIYKIMPRVKVGWEDVWIGAAVTALLFTLGRFLIGMYIGKTGVASSFGAAGSIGVVFVWVYYSAQIFLVGAEFTWVYAQRLGSRRQLHSRVDAPSHAEAVLPTVDEAGGSAVIAAVPSHGAMSRSTLAGSDTSLAHTRCARATWVAWATGAACLAAVLVVARREEFSLARERGLSSRRTRSPE